MFPSRGCNDVMRRGGDQPTQTLAHRTASSGDILLIIHRTRISISTCLRKEAHIARATLMDGSSQEKDETKINAKADYMRLDQNMTEQNR